MWEWLANLFTGRTRAERVGNEADVDPDPAQARTRATGGADDPVADDAHSTTAPSTNDTFVGRVAGDDAGDVGVSGAEARAEAAEHARPEES